MKYVLMAGIVILIGFIVALSYIPIGIEPLTEVYFENHTKLPVNMKLNESRSFSFSVHNLEYKEMNYSYDIGVEYENSSQIIPGEQFILADNETRTFTKSFSFSSPFDRAKVSVFVKKDNNESIDIHFWVNELTPLTIRIIRDNESIPDLT